MNILRKSLVCLILSLLMHAGAQPALAQGFKWWQTERFKKELALTTEQVARIEGVYQASDPLLRAQRKAVAKDEEKVSKIINDPASDEPTLLQAVDRLESARSELSRTRNLLLFRIRRVLTDEQNLKLNEMYRRDRDQHERNERERRDNNSNNGKKPGGQPDCQ